MGIPSRWPRRVVHLDVAPRKMAFGAFRLLKILHEKVRHIQADPVVHSLGGALAYGSPADRGEMGRVDIHNRSGGDGFLRLNLKAELADVHRTDANLALRAFILLPAELQLSVDGYTFMRAALRRFRRVLG